MATRLGQIGTHVGLPGSSLCRVVWATIYQYGLCVTRVHGGEIKTEESTAKSVRKDVKFRMMFK